jgi:DNA invertase Pin-like site-specific DNA recombinase
MDRPSPKYVAYLRVSTVRQGRSGLGLEAQQKAVREFVAGRAGVIIAPEFVEVESGKKDKRPELQRALKRCRVTGATLVVAKIDRLSRNAAFLMTLRDSGVDFVAADLPDANTMTVGIMATVAQYEREAISARTKAALAASQARRKAKIAAGDQDAKLLGGFRAKAADIRLYQASGVEAARAAAVKAAEERRDMLESLAGDGLSLNAIAARLNFESVTTSRGGKWTATAVKRTLATLSRAMPLR